VGQRDECFVLQACEDEAFDCGLRAANSSFFLNPDTV